jgi:vitamin B12/bleomycin/antimicrobial peptide transport system ATP-binding/permease protein
LSEWLEPAGNLSDFLYVIGTMAKPEIKPKPPENNSSAEKSEFVEVDAENDDHVEPPTPEVVEPDPEMSPEEAE